MEGSNREASLSLCDAVQNSRIGVKPDQSVRKGQWSSCHIYTHAQSFLQTPGCAELKAKEWGKMAKEEDKAV